MADQTGFDKKGIDAAADAIGRIMDTRRQDFQAIVQQWPTAGQFATATWLERIVDDRRNGLVEHAKRLDEAFEQMQTKLKSVSADLDGTDADNAAALRDLDDMKTKIGSLVTDYDNKTEQQQKNFSGGSGDHKIGDGYNDDLTTSIG